MTKVVITYHRTGDTYAYHVAFMLEGMLVERRGEGRPFGAVIHVLSDVLRTCCPDATVVMRRSDRPGLEEIVLDNQLRDTIRDDPDRYLRATTEPDRVVVVRKRSPEQYVSPHIRAGYDTVAEAFGDHLYVRLRDDGRVECPMCGRWHAVIHEGSVVPMLRCTCNPTGIPVTVVSGSWIEIATTVLTTVEFLTRYYFPRSWNPEGWITKDELKQRYNQYLKETEHVRE